MEKYYKWNFIMGLIHRVFYAIAMSVADIITVIPVFLGTFVQSRISIGLILSFIALGSVMPQLYVAKKLVDKARKKYMLDISLAVRLLSWFFLAGIVYFYGKTSNASVISFILLVFVFFFFGGVAKIPYFHIISRAIPVNRRGRFFGLGKMLGGLSAIVAGAIVTAVLSGHLPANKKYGILFFITGLFLTAAYTGLFLIKETSEKVEPKPGRFKEHLADIIKNDKPFMKFIFTVILIYTAQLAMPYYILYFKQTGKSSLALMLGLFIILQKIFGALSNLGWGYISDHISNRTNLILAGALTIIMPILALLHLFIPLFIFMGIFISGLDIAVNNYLLELSPKDKMPLYLSLHGIFVSPRVFMPLLGGFLAQVTGYKILFSITLLLGIAALVSSFFLKELRRKINSAKGALNV